MSRYEEFEQHVHRTFAEAAERYLDEFEGEDVSRIMQSIEALLPYIGPRRLIDVDDEALETFKHDRQRGRGHFKRPAMANTVNKDLQQAATILNRASRVWQWVPSAPKLSRLVGESRSNYPITWEEQDRLFSNFPTGWDTAALLFTLNTGVRKEQLFGLRWDDLVERPDLGPDVFMFVLRHSAKKRAVVCNSIARRCVGHMKGKDARFVFSKTYTRCQSGKAWKAAWEKAGLPNNRLVKRGFDNLWHTCAHRLRAYGVPEADRNVILGRRQLHDYSTPHLKRLLAAAERITIRREMPVVRLGGYDSQHDTRGHQ